MKVDLHAAARRSRNIRRRFIYLPEIAAPDMFAVDLYQSCYLPVIAAWKEQASQVIAEYERTRGEMTLDSPADIEREVEEAAGFVSRLFITLTPSLRAWALRVDRSIRTKWRGAVLSATGVDLDTMMGPADARETLETSIQWNTALIRDVSDEIRTRVSNTVYSGLAQGKSAREVGKEIDEAVELGRKRSLRIASDQLSKLSNALADERRREAGLDIWEWHHSGKRHPREEHRARDGLLYTDNPAHVGKKVDGKTVRLAPPRGDRPGQPPYCGCRARGVMVFEFDN